MARTAERPALLDELKDQLAPVALRLPSYARLVWELYRDPEVPKGRKVLLSAGLAYSLSPIDLIPGFIPAIGQLDDLYVLLRTALGVLDGLPAERRESHLRAVGLTRATLEDDLRRLRAAAARLAREGIRASGRAAVWGLRVAAAGARRVGRAALLFARKGVRR